jgi:hypothetical protein
MIPSAVTSVIALFLKNDMLGGFEYEKARRTSLWPGESRSDGYAKP